MLFEGGRALFMKNWKKLGFDSKSHTLTHFVAFEVSRKTVAKSIADSIMQLAILSDLIHKESLL